MYPYLPLQYKKTISAKKKKKDEIHFIKVTFDSNSNKNFIIFLVVLGIESNVTYSPS
jgi:hypothetical protein